MEREKRVSRVSCAVLLGVNRTTLNNWEIFCVTNIPDYARFYEARKGLTYHQLWVMGEILTRFKNGLGRPKLTWNEINEGVQRLANQLTLEDYFAYLRSIETA